MTNDIAGVDIELLDTDGADIGGLFSMQSCNIPRLVYQRKLKQLADGVKISRTKRQGSTTDDTLGFSSCLRPQAGIAGY